jgi:hypothetical protein
MTDKTHLAPGQVNQDDVNAIEAGSRHDPDEQLGRWCNQVGGIARLGLGRRARAQIRARVLRRLRWAWRTALRVAARVLAVGA